MVQVTQRYIIGVDGGGSSCRVAICAPDGTRLAQADGPAANPATSMPDAVRSIRATLDTARRKASLAEAQTATARAWLGLAGVMNESIAAEVAAAMPMPATVTDDRPTNMAGALGDRDGFLAAIGTGSFLGRQRGAEQGFVGGWGLQLGDQASGAWLGRALLVRVLEWRDALHQPTPLLQATFAQFNDDTSAIVTFAASAAPHQYAAFAPQILQAADDGDTAGLALIRDGAAYIQQALNVLGFRQGDALCLIGGIGPRYAPYLGARYTGTLIDPKGSALDGALRLAAALP